MKSLCNIPLRIAGAGAYVPDEVMDNSRLEEMVETSDEWIVQRTGIRERRIAATQQATSDLAAEAARTALKRAGVKPENVDAIIVCTCSPDHIFPSTACLTQALIGAENAFCYDLQAACSGFVFGFAQGASLIAAGMAENVLVIGAETLSRFTDWTDRGSCILFGDGAGAVLLQKNCRNDESNSELVFCELGSDGNRPDVLNIEAGGARKPASHHTVEQRQHFMHLDGRDVFKLAVGKLGELVDSLPIDSNIDMEDIALIIPHQSNERIIRSVCRRAGLSQDRAFMNIESVGNTSAASIPMAMEQAIQEGKLNRGDLALLLAFGGGLTWGSMLIRY